MFINTKDSPNPLMEIQAAYVEVSQFAGVPVQDSQSLFKTAVILANFQERLDHGYVASIGLAYDELEALAQFRRELLLDPRGLDLFESDSEDNLPQNRRLPSVKTSVVVTPDTGVKVMEKLGILEPERDLLPEERDSLAKLYGGQTPETESPVARLRNRLALRLAGIGEPLRELGGSGSFAQLRSNDETGESVDFASKHSGMVNANFTSPKLGEGAFLAASFCLKNDVLFPFYGVDLTPRFIDRPNPTSSLVALKRSLFRG